MSIKSPIQITNFSKKYKDKVIHINNISITKKVTIFVGENGCGKSTLLKAILNLIDYEGTIINNNTLSYMPENPYIPGEITVKDFISNLYQTSKNDYDYNPFISEYGLKSKMDSQINTLSKGMRAKLNLIQCLIQNKDVYILDEPLNGLDKESVKTLITYIKKSNKSFIISTHLNTTFDLLEKEIIYLD